MNTQNDKPKPNPAKEALNGYRWMLKRRDELANELAESYGRATSCTVRLKPQKTSGGNASYDRMADDVVQSVDTRERLKQKISELDRKLADIMTLIDLVNDERGRVLLTMRYIRGMRWEDIQREMKYSEKQTKRIHGYALLEINNRKFPKDDPK